MSSRVVRQWFRAQLPIRVPSLPYIDTVNSVPSPKNMPDLWVTLEFTAASEQRLTIGSAPVFREYGVVNIVVVGLSGRGDDPVVEAAELYKQAFEQTSLMLPIGGESGAFRIDAVDPPSTDISESGNWFLCSVSCAYTLDVVRSG